MGPGPLRSWPLRWHLVLLIAGALLPVVVFSAVIVLRLTHQMQQEVERSLQRSSYEISWAFEREVSATIRTLLALAQSEHLDQGDVEAFRAEALRVQRSQPSWLTVILLTPEGQQLLNLRRPPGAPLPRAIEPESLRRTVEQRQPVVGGLALSKLGPAVGLSDPGAGHPGGARAVCPLRDHHPSGAGGRREAAAGPVGMVELTRTIVDRAGPHRLPHARPRALHRHACHRRLPRAHPGRRPRVCSAASPWRATHSYVAFSRSALSGWTSAVVVPVEAHRRSFPALGLGHRGLGRAGAAW